MLEQDAEGDDQAAEDAKDAIIGQGVREKSLHAVSGVVVIWFERIV